MFASIGPVKKSADPESLVGIDVARGFAALSVFVYHYNVGLVIQKATGFRVSTAFAVIGAEYAVPLFFLISGFCIHLSQLRQEARHGAGKIRLTAYLKRRFLRIYPAYLAALFLSIGATMISGGAVSGWDILIHLFMLHGVVETSFNTLNLVLWSVSIETLLYLLYPVWWLVRRRIGLTRAVLATLGVSAFSAAVCAFWLFPYTPTVKWAVPTIWFGWVFGAWLAEVWSSNRAIFNGWRWWAFGLGGVAIYLVALALDWFEGPAAILKIPAMIVCWAFPLTVVLRWSSTAMRPVIAWVVAPLAFVGAFSYSLYLLHMPMMQLRDILWTSVASPTARVMIWIGWFGLTLATSWAWYRLFERPFMHLRRVAPVVQFTAMADA